MKQELVLLHKAGGAVPLSLRSRALSSVSMRGNSSLLGHLWKKKHQTGTYTWEDFVLVYWEL